jgi:hypothetical protein
VVPYARFVSLGSAVTSFEGVGVDGDDCVPYVPNSRFWRMLARERAALRSSTCVAVLGAAPTSAAAFDKTGAAQDAVANPIMIAPAIAVATGCFVTFFIVISLNACAAFGYETSLTAGLRQLCRGSCGGARLELEASYSTPTSQCRREHFSSLNPQSP